MTTLPPDPTATRASPRCGRSCCRSAGTPDGRATGGSPGPTRTAELREWFAGAAAAPRPRGRRWTGRATSGRGGATRTPPRPAATAAWLLGSHLDSVPDGGAYDGPLGVVSALAAVEVLQAQGFQPGRPIAVVNFGDEEGARYGVACAGSRLLTGALEADRALGAARQRRVDDGRGDGGRRPGPGAARPGSRCAATDRHVRRAARRAGPGAGRPRRAGRRRQRRSGRTAAGGSTSPARPTTRARPAWPTASDPMLAYAAGRPGRPGRRPSATTPWRRSARCACEPNGVNAIPSAVTAWLDARGPSAAVVERAGRGARAGPARRSLASRGPTRRRSTAGSRSRLAVVLAGLTVTGPDAADRRGSRRRHPGAGRRRRPRCCSCATRPASRTPPRSSPRRPTASPGSRR